MRTRILRIAVSAALLCGPGFAHECQPAPEPDRASTWYELHTPISDQFRKSLDTRTSEKLKSWASEIHDAYLTDGRLVYRGVCDRADREAADYLRMFVTVSDDLLSKHSGNSFHAASPGAGDFDLRRSIFADLSRFNQDAYLYSLYREALVHQKGPVGDNQATYEDSYGFSTSWSFWMAAEFAGLYPGDEPCANSVVFGMFPAKHFLDYATLERVDTRFKRLYPDERETLGAGGVDPDSVMLIARLEAMPGKQTPVINEILLRDPQRPDRVLHLAGGIDVFDAEVAAGWELYLRDQAETEKAIREYGVDPQTPPSVPPDSRFRVRPRKTLKIEQGGRPAVPRAVHELDYGLPIYPQPTGSAEN